MIIKKITSDFYPVILSKVFEFELKENAL